MWDELSGLPSGLIQPRTELDKSEVALNSWFTPLWTFQEAALRPDLWLRTKDWSVLSREDEEKAISLGGIPVLVWTFDVECPGYLDAYAKR